MIRRRPASQPVSYQVSPENLKKTKEFNENLRYVQGFRTTVPAGATVPVQIGLTAPGRKLLGIALIPSSKTTDISDVLTTLVVNNNNVLLNTSSSNANPLDTQGMIFFPVPQPLAGNDTITLTYQNNSAVSVIINCNVFYVPR
jgi:hypothetical protein